MSKIPTIPQVNAAARAAHMSYGNFVAKGCQVPREILRQVSPQRRQRRNLIDREAFENLYYMGCTDTVIAQHLNVQYDAVGNFRRRLGLAPNRKQTEEKANYDKCFFG